ncbi:hypothetical protein CYMTET_56720 [Cymbomonas tetramitiformis]|uniref:Uncharacterized protein n=1 Tax=Cymbomonas tetramitiformis TaxID=36881 RepID=A0AAE0BAQ8_9CHLO|nr:hypothetical protein CYMTET_56720 [Cymbomonas tetramitiformis]
MWFITARCDNMKRSRPAFHHKLARLLFLFLFILHNAAGPDGETGSWQRDLESGADSAHSGLALPHLLSTANSSATTSFALKTISTRHLQTSSSPTGLPTFRTDTGHVTLTSVSPSSCENYGCFYKCIIDFDVAVYSSGVFTFAAASVDSCGTCNGGSGTTSNAGTSASGTFDNSGTTFSADASGTTVTVSVSDDLCVGTYAVTSGSVLGVAPGPATAAARWHQGRQLLLRGGTRAGNCCCVVAPGPATAAARWHQGRQLLLRGGTRAGNCCCAVAPGPATAAAWWHQGRQALPSASVMGRHCSF